MERHRHMDLYASSQLSLQMRTGAGEVRQKRALGLGVTSMIRVSDVSPSLDPCPTEASATPTVLNPNFPIHQLCSKPLSLGAVCYTAKLTSALAPLSLTVVSEPIM